MTKPYREPKPSSQLEDRLPIATYDKALWRLVQFEFAGVHSPEALKLARQIVGDIFWETEKTVQKHVQRAKRQLGG